MSGPVGSMHHVGIVVRDLDAAEAFVTGAFGLPAVNRLASTELGMRAVAVLLWFLLARLPVGRRLYAVGGNRRAAQLSGIPADRLVIASFALSGLLSAVAGVILGSRLGSTVPGSEGAYLLPAFAGAFLGATAIQPGRFNAIGTVLAAYTLSVVHLRAATARSCSLGPAGVQRNGPRRGRRPLGLRLAAEVKATRARTRQLARLTGREDAPVESVNGARR